MESLLETETPPLKLRADEPVYGMMDGAMIFTREEGWKEVKLGRVFKEQDLFSLTEKRNWLRASEYTAHLGEHKVFEQKFGVVLDKYDHLDDRLAFISDGAKSRSIGMELCRGRIPESHSNTRFLSCCRAFSQIF